MSVKKHMAIFWTALLLGHLSYSTGEKKEGRREGRDTYLDAYSDTHVSPDLQSNSPTVVFPGQTYGVPFPSYNTPVPNIHPFYDSPSGVSGLSGPSGLSEYGVPLSPVYGAPFAAPDHGFKGLSVGLDFATVCKIILKVLIFKMIVKFIAVICVLLFLPKLDSGGSSAGDSKLLLSNEDTGGAFKGQLNRLTRLVLESVDKNSAPETEENCAGDALCRLRRVAEYVDGHNSVPRLLTMFLLQFNSKQYHSGGKGYH